MDGRSVVQAGKNAVKLLAVMLAGGVVTLVASSRSPRGGPEGALPVQPESRRIEDTRSTDDVALLRRERDQALQRMRELQAQVVELRRLQRGTTETAEDKTDSSPEDKKASAVEKVVLRRAGLDSRIDFVPRDPQWEHAVSASIKDVFDDWSAVELRAARCSQELCRIEFVAGVTDQEIEMLMEQINNAPAVEGERMIQINDSVDPPEGIAYFSRSGAISLATAFSDYD